MDVVVGSLRWDESREYVEEDRAPCYSFLGTYNYYKGTVFVLSRH
jgi:hypothetical protein